MLGPIPRRLRTRPERTRSATGAARRADHVGGAAVGADRVRVRLRELEQRRERVRRSAMWALSTARSVAGEGMKRRSAASLVGTDLPSPDRLRSRRSAPCRRSARDRGPAARAARRGRLARARAPRAGPRQLPPAPALRLAGAGRLDDRRARLGRPARSRRSTTTRRGAWSASTRAASARRASARSRGAARATSSRSAASTRRAGTSRCSPRRRRIIHAVTAVGRWPADLDPRLRRRHRAPRLEHLPPLRRWPVRRARCAPRPSARTPLRCLACRHAGGYTCPRW